MERARIQQMKMRVFWLDPRPGVGRCYGDFWKLYRLNHDKRRQIVKGTVDSLETEL